MTQQRRYFDNAATSFPKPPAVHLAMLRYARTIGASAGRGAYREALAAEDIIRQTRRGLAELLNIPDPENVIMTFNCTDGLSLAIKGLLTEPASHVITTRMDHNSVLRPLGALREQLDIEISYLAADGQGLTDPEDLRRSIGPRTRLIVVVHGSNVCGSLQDIAAMGAIAREHQIPFVVDAAQTVGHLPLDMQELPVDVLAFPGHKALLGPLGTGALYIRSGMETRIRPLKEGGTGSRSEIPLQPEMMPDRFESGSHNLIGIAGLLAGLTYLRRRGLAAIRARETELINIFLEQTADVAGLTVYGPRRPAERVGVFSVSIAGYEPAELAAILEDRFGLLTRPGLHCAPFAHETLGTLGRGGTVRFSFGCFLSEDDVVFAAEALRQIAAGRAAP
ncbi:MAG: aminotransferase class V-fold PLP-dependent enzyme [Sedimentisphaerales bacterium]|nr:aminotransferase class V-fold PLP-dependent enzyme [Sedimentisphaerales bacterium]